MTDRIASSIAALLITFGVTLGSSPNALGADNEAEAAKEKEPKPYSGAFYGPEAYVGLGWSRGSGERVGSTTFGFRHSFVFLLGDSRLSYAFDASLDQERPERHGLWLQTCLHPSAPLLLGSDWLAYLLASPYVELGLGGLAYVARSDIRVQTPALGWSIGGGLDIPLGDPDDGSSPWLQLLYRHRVDGSNLQATQIEPRADLLYLGVGWRINGALF